MYQRENVHFVLGAKDVTEYWELLSGYNDGYNKIKYEWSKIANLHKKVLTFVINNLSHKYKITMNDTIPAYLLGKLTLQQTQICKIIFI